MLDNNFYWAKGVVHYKDDDWVIIECPYSVVNYYKWWIEKFTGKKISTSYHKPHITVVAAKHEPARDKTHWKKWEGQKVEFMYNGIIYSNKTVGADRYFWLVVECPTAGIIRGELGLKPNLKWPYHLTIGYLGY